MHARSAVFIDGLRNSTDAEACDDFSHISARLHLNRVQLARQLTSADKNILPTLHHAEELFVVQHQ
jgi:hypothetical protein